MSHLYVLFTFGFCITAALLTLDLPVWLVLPALGWLVCVQLSAAGEEA